MKGQYGYWLNGDQTDIVETWTVETWPRGKRKILSERQAPRSGSRIRVEAFEINGNITRFSVDWANAGERAVKTAQASYAIEPEQVNVARVVAGQEFVETHSINAPVIVSPLLRIFMGQVIRQAAEPGQATTVLVPWILDPTNHDLLLSAKFEPRSARRLCAEPVTLGQQVYQAEKYEYLGGNYDDTAEFWLDERDVLLRYCWTQSDKMRWDVVLTDRAQ